MPVVMFTAVARQMQFWNSLEVTGSCNWSKEYKTFTQTFYFQFYSEDISQYKLMFSSPLFLEE